MTTAQKGLAKALGRSASGAVVAIAEMSTAEILASLDDDKKAELSAALSPPSAPEPAAAAAAEDMPPKKKDGCSEDGDEDDAEGDSDKEKPKPPMAEASDDRVKIVAAAVENDDACKGKASLALQMLADDDYAGLNGSALVKLIGKTPIEGASASLDGEEAARAEMKSVLQSQNGSNIAPNASAAPGQSANSTSVWDKAIARVCPGAAK